MLLSILFSLLLSFSSLVEMLALSYHTSFRFARVIQKNFVVFKVSCFSCIEFCILVFSPTEKKNRTLLNRIRPVFLIMQLGLV